MKNYNYLILCILCFTQTACFEVLEELDLQTPQGQGKYQLTLNLSQSKNKLVSMMALDTLKGFKIPKKEQIQAELYRLQTTLSQQQGISNVQVQQDFEQFIFSVRLDFQNLNALEKAVLTTIRTFQPKPDWVAPTNNLVLQNKTIRRKGEYGFGKNLDQISPETRQYLQQAVYTHILRLQNPILRTSNPDQKISKSGKSAFLKYNLWQIVSAEKNIGYEIGF